MLSFEVCDFESYLNPVTCNRGMQSTSLLLSSFFVFDCLAECEQRLNKTSTSDFGDFLTRLRLGDDDAIRSFVSKYEPFIRRTLRFRIARASLQSAADSVDVCQSVLGGFLLRLAAGDYTLTSEDDLRRLLVAIANKKFLVLNRRETAAKRDHRHTQSLDLGRLIIMIC